jgi:hypothetical protein
VLDLDAEEARTVKELLIEHKDMFTGPGVPLGRTSLVKHSIFTGDAAPIRQRLRRIAPAHQKVVEEEVQRLLREGLIRPSYSPWASPIVLATKKDGTRRLCSDARLLNSVTRKDAFPVMSISQCLDSLSGSVWFCTLDLAAGYNQVAIEEEDCHKTAFITTMGLFEHVVMPFGLCNAPATFQRLMVAVLSGLQWKTCLVYLDDIIIPGKSCAEVLSRLREVIDRLRTAGLRLKPSKCHLFKQKVEFLGHVVSAAGVTCDPAKVEAVQEWPAPRKVTDVRAFLGLAGYYRRFIGGFAHIAAPLTKLTRKNEPFVWDEQSQQAFETLKGKLVRAPILAYPSSDPECKYILDTDASQFAMSGILSQVQDGQEKVIAYGSQMLSAAQRAYSTTYRELLACVTFMLSYKHYLIGCHFVLRTDHGSSKH